MIYFKYVSNPIDFKGTTLRLKVKCVVKCFAWIVFKFFLISHLPSFLAHDTWSVQCVGSVAFQVNSMGSRRLQHSNFHCSFCLALKEFWLMDTKGFFDVIFSEELMLFIPANSLCCLVYLFSSALNKKGFLQTIGCFALCVCGLLNPDLGKMYWSSAGMNQCCLQTWGSYAYLHQLRVWPVVCCVNI